MGDLTGTSLLVPPVALYANERARVVVLKKSVNSSIPAGPPCSRSSHDLMPDQPSYCVFAPEIARAVFSTGMPTPVVMMGVVTADVAEVATGTAVYTTSPAGARDGSCRERTCCSNGVAGTGWPIRTCISPAEKYAPVPIADASANPELGESLAASASPPASCGSMCPWKPENLSSPGLANFGMKSSTGVPITSGGSSGSTAW
eukprot:CAMPEP_0119303042 /NCGR_PEP_ID=MMETSP1333-20130426/4540_1 /TAXON_ID=418940 /ORGANISM="Scyphosphaera apsteinii, Strain RCC1455" /LENGTH=202 /DNA_ID=CAMNT_0007305603 /DNA_START=741 /DNA_END=1347 /DNA_ORIENTATION=-